MTLSFLIYLNIIRNRYNCNKYFYILDEKIRQKIESKNNHLQNEYCTLKHTYVDAIQEQPTFQEVTKQAKRCQGKKGIT